MKLKVDIKQLAPCEKKLQIDVDGDLVSQEFGNFYDSVAKRARIPGFRPGRAPRNVVARHFKEEARREVLKHLLWKSLSEAVRQENIAVIGSPKVEQIDFDESHLTYSAHVETRPKIKLGTYTGMTIKRKPIFVDETELTDALKRLQESRAKFSAIEGRAARMDDYLIADYQLAIEGREVEKRQGEWFKIQENDFLKGFSTQLINATAGDEKKVTITFPKDYPKKEWAGKEGIFLVNVKEIKQRDLAPLNDEFAKELGDYATLDALKNEIRKDLETEKSKQRDSEEETIILEDLVKKSKFDVPNRMIERRLEALVEEGIRALLYRGVQKEKAESERDELKKKLQEQAERDVRVSFILSEISEKEKIRALDEDMIARYAHLAAQYRTSVDELKAYYEADEERKDYLRFQIQQEKTIRWLKDHAVIKD